MAGQGSRGGCPKFDNGYADNGASHELLAAIEEDKRQQETDGFHKRELVRERTSAIDFTDPFSKHDEHGGRKDKHRGEKSFRMARQKRRMQPLWPPTPFQ